MPHDLKPCPFCGGEPVFASPRTGGLFIECRSCRVSTNLRYACGDDPAPLLAEQWNRRAQPAAATVPGDEREAFEKAHARYNLKKIGDARSDYFNLSTQARWEAWQARAALAAPAAPQHATIIDHKEKEMLTDDQIKTMVDRFLAWKLPADFAPDAGIKFDPVFNKGTPYEMRHEPTGTNLFHAQQAEAMVRHMVEGIAAPQPEAAPQEQPSDAKQMVLDWMGENDVVLKARAFKQLCALLSRYGASPQGGEDAQPVAWRYRYAGEFAPKGWCVTDVNPSGIKDIEIFPLYTTPQPAGRDAREVPDET